MGTDVVDTLNEMIPLPYTEEEQDDILMRAEGEGPDNQTLSDIFKNVTINEDIILVIDAGAEEFLRRGLATIKYKANKVAKEAGIEYDSRSLEFRLLPWTAEEKKLDAGWQKKSKIQVYLKDKQSIRVHRMMITDKEF